MWNEPIYDRSIADIQLKTNKAYINTSDLNRIEENIVFLSDLFNCIVQTKTWNDGEFVYLNDLIRIKSNIEILISSYYKGPKSPNLPLPPFTDFYQWNDIEKIIDDIYSLFYSNKGAVSFCGEISAGQTIGVI